MKRVVFELKDWFGCICTKGSFLDIKKSKLMFKEDGSFRFLEEVNSYKVDL
jgi:hypothetical protein